MFPNKDVSFISNANPLRTAGPVCGKLDSCREVSQVLEKVSSWNKRVLLLPLPSLHETCTQVQPAGDCTGESQVSFILTRARQQHKAIEVVLEVSYEVSVATESLQELRPQRQHGGQQETVHRGAYFAFLFS